MGTWRSAGTRRSSGRWIQPWASGVSPPTGRHGDPVAAPIGGRLAGRLRPDGVARAAVALRFGHGGTARLAAAQRRSFGGVAPVRAVAGRRWSTANVGWRTC
jgi:hypothetical protein